MSEFLNRSLDGLLDVLTVEELIELRRRVDEKLLMTKDGITAFLEEMVKQGVITPYEIQVIACKTAQKRQKGLLR